MSTETLHIIRNVAVFAVLWLSLLALAVLVGRRLRTVRRTHSLPVLRRSDVSAWGAVARARAGTGRG